MANIVFSSFANGKRKQTKRVKLELHSNPEVPAHFTYINEDGLECKYNGNYNKAGDTYTFTKHITKRIPVTCEVNNTYLLKDSCFTYMDPDNKERVFSKMDSLKFDGTSYTGDIDVVEYTDTIVKLEK